MAPGYGTRRRPRKSSTKKSTASNKDAANENGNSPLDSTTVANAESGLSTEQTTTATPAAVQNAAASSSLNVPSASTKRGRSSTPQDGRKSLRSRSQRNSATPARSVKAEQTPSAPEQQPSTNGQETNPPTQQQPPESSKSGKERGKQQQKRQEQDQSTADVPRYNVEANSQVASTIPESRPDDNRENLHDNERRIKEEEDMRIAEYLLTQLKEGGGAAAVAAAFASKGSTSARSETPKVAVHSPPPEDEPAAAAAGETEKEGNGFSALETLAAVAAPMQAAGGTNGDAAAAAPTRSRRTSNADTLIIEDSSTSGDTQVDEEDPFSLRPNLNATQPTDGDTSVVNTPVEESTEPAQSMEIDAAEKQDDKTAEVGELPEPTASNAVVQPEVRAPMSDDTIDEEGDTDMASTQILSSVETVTNNAADSNRSITPTPQRPVPGTNSVAEQQQLQSAVAEEHEAGTLGEEIQNDSGKATEKDRQFTHDQNAKPVEEVSSDAKQDVQESNSAPEVEVSEDPQAIAAIAAAVVSTPEDVAKETSSELVAPPADPPGAISPAPSPQEEPMESTIQQPQSPETMPPEFSEALARSAAQALSASAAVEAQANTVPIINISADDIQQDDDSRMHYDDVQMGQYQSGVHTGVQSPQPSDVGYDHNMDTDMNDQAGNFAIDPALINEGRIDSSDNNQNSQTIIPNHPNSSNVDFSLPQSSFNLNTSSSDPNSTDSLPYNSMAPTKTTIHRVNQAGEVDNNTTDCCMVCRRAVPLITSNTHRAHVVKTNWICCDGCKFWFHNACINMSDREVDEVDKYFCADCHGQRGVTTYLTRRRSKRPHVPIDYNSLNEGSNAPFVGEDDKRVHHYVKYITQTTFQPDNFPRIAPELLSKKFFEENDGFKTPIVIPGSMNPRPEGEAPDKLGMVIPPGLTVRKVGKSVGMDETVIVLDVMKQQEDEEKWDFSKWIEYYETPEDRRDKVRNVISQEISHSDLGKRIKRPTVVEEIDLAKRVWPGELLKDFPKVTLYCLMSVKDSYTDFHVDFGGSSVFYHIVEGKKTFLFMPPTKQNLSAYEKWNLNENQNAVFLPNILGDAASFCIKVELEAGDTMFIPSGWIHAVHTPEDSLVFGGNFLTELSLEQQIQIVQIEKNTKVDSKFKYPRFQQVMWYAMLDYLKNDPLPEEYHKDVALLKAIKPASSPTKAGKRKVGAKSYSKWEIDGFRALEDFLIRTALISNGIITQGITQETRKRVKASIPKAVGNDYLSPVQLFARWSAWQRCDGYIPHWALKNWTPGDGIPGASTGPEKKIELTAAQEKKLKKDAEAQKRREEGPQREGLRKKDMTTTPEAPKQRGPKPKSARFGSVSDFKPDFKGAQEKISQEPPPKPRKGRPPKKRDPETGQIIQGPETPASRPKQSAMQTPATAPPKASAAAATPAPRAPSSQPRYGVTDLKTTALHDSVSRTIRNKFEHTSSPKNSILGPKRTACDDCRRQKISCKHKAEVALAEEEITRELAKNVEVEQAQNPQGFFSLQQSQQQISQPQPDLPYKISKNGRPVACEACKKSRRRCIHNGQQDFPPAARRSVKPGSESKNGIARLASDELSGLTPTPRGRKRQRVGSIGSESSFDSLNADSMNGFAGDGIQPVNGDHGGFPATMDSNPFALPQSNFTDEELHDGHDAFSPDHDQPRPSFLSVALRDDATGEEAALGDQSGLYADPTGQFAQSAQSAPYGTNYPHFEAAVEEIDQGIARHSSHRPTTRDEHDHEFDHYTNNGDVVNNDAANLFLAGGELAEAAAADPTANAFSLRGQKRQRDEDGDTLLGAGEDGLDMAAGIVGSPPKKVCLEPSLNL